MFGRRPSPLMVALLAVVTVAFRPSRFIEHRTMKPASSKSDLVLKRSLTDYIANPTAFRDFYSAISDGNGAPSITVATGDPLCKTSTVTITPLKESWKVAHKKDFRDGFPGTAPYGYILARIDAATCDFTRIGLKAGRRAYWVVNLDNNLILTSHFIDVGPSNPPTGATAEAKPLLPNQLLAYAECPQPHGFTDDAAAVQPRANVCWAHDGEKEFQSRVGRRKVYTRTTFTSEAGEVHLITDITDPPRDQFVWIVCADGCCYADTRS
jgi:hypothetical protein